MNQVFDYIDSSKFFEHKQIDNGPFSRTTLASYKETQEKFSQRKITIQQEEAITKFKDICEKLFKMQYPYSIKPYYAALPDTTNNTPAALYTPYAENNSLKALIQKLEDAEIIENFDSTQKMIIIHGILIFLNAIHQDNQLHGRIKISNILLDSQLYPLISDAFLYKLNENCPLNDSNSRMIDYIVSLPPEIIQNKEYTAKSDIYSFGILILQVLTNQINVYSDITSDCSEIIRLKQAGHLPNISDVQNEKLRDLICQCLDSDPEKRPNANEIIDIIEEIEADESEYDIQRLNNFKSLSNNNNNNLIDDLENQDLIEMKKLADEGDIDKMYEYGYKRFIGTEDCPCDIQEAKKYISMAAEQGNENAKSLFQLIHSDLSINKEQTNIQLEEEQTQNPIEPKLQTKIITHLKDDQFFTREKADVQLIIEKVKENYITIAKKTKNFTQAKLGKKSFIFTEGAIIRLTKLFYYLKSCVPVLLEGPTGTSKTLSSEIVCQLIDKPLLKFNLSSETKASYLLGRYRGDVDSWAGLSMTVGPFRDAYENGYILLLDEINLASAECLKFIGEALDSKKISVEMPGMPLREIPMHPEFRLIATQNPNKGLFASKRQDLDPAFLSRFQIIDFPSFEKDELVKIAEGLAKSFNFNTSDKFIQDFVDFHMTWSSREDVKGDVQCFTIREIAAAVHALAEGNNCYDTIMTIYGARYKKRQKENLKNLFLSKESFKDMKPSEFEYPDNFPKCFHNKNLAEALKAIKFSFDNNRHVILTGSEGNGITQVARWVAQYYNNNNYDNNNKNKNNDEFFCVCTEETKCSDLIGSQKPSDNMNSGQELIVFKLGLLTVAIEQGKCVVFDSLDEAPSTVCERLNGLFDEKYDGEKKLFEIPENPQGEPIEINSKFRMLCTCRIDKINQMSPAFVNRFDVIVLEDQLEDITDEKLKELIELLMTIKIVPVSLSSKSSNDVNNIKNDQVRDLLFGSDDENTEGFEEDDEDVGGFEEDDEDVGGFEEDDEDVGGFEKEDENMQGFEKGDKHDNKEIKKNEQEKQITNNTEKETKESVKNEIISNESEFKPPLDLINLVFNSFNQIKNSTTSNDDKLATMYKLSRLCKAVSKYFNLFSNVSDITNETIVNFATDFLMKTGDFVVPKEIETFFIDKLNRENKDDDGQYFFADSPPLRSHIAKLYAASVINQPLVVYGGTGVGKTSAARAFGRLRRNQQNRSLQCLMLSFHAGTKSNNIFGTTTILNGKVAFVNGPLTTALQKGGTFIADEMNLSTSSTMKSIAPALEPCIGEKVFISGVGESIKIHNDFFFVACQNELGTIGRNPIPSSIASRFRILYYPLQQEEDVSTICKDISNNFYNNDSGIKPNFSLDDASNVGKYMIKLNQEKQKIIPQWSLRDITKLFKRIHHQDEQIDYYQNLSFYHNVLFYTLAPVGKSELKGIFNTILKLIGDTFGLDAKTRKELKESYETEATIQNFGKGSYIMKGNTGISTDLFPNFKDYIKEFSGLPSLLECIFQILLSDSSEPILLMGPSGYKTFISKLFLQKAKVIALTQETSVSQLIGSSAFLTKSEAKHFYLDLICRICHIYDGNKITELKNKLSKRQLVKTDITSITKIYLQYNSSFTTTVHRLTEKLFENSTKNNDQGVLSDMVIEFRPGLILLPILQGDSIILKDLSNLQTIVIERFNELLTGKHNLTVSEDIHDTITDSDQKELSGFSSFFRVFGTCPPNSAVKLSEAVLSRFTVINTSEYKKDEQGNVLKSYNIINAKKLSNEIIDLIIEFSKSVHIHLKKAISFTQLINILEICSRLIQNISSVSPKNILGIVLYRIFVGLLERRTEYKDKINTIFNEINVPIPSQFLNPINESPFLVTNKDGFQGIESKITGLFIYSTEAKEVSMNVAYTPPFTDMLDIIHFGILAKIPVILEGNAGQGKQKAIEYVAKHLGYEVINIVMSKSTKVDDLLGKVSIEPDEKNNIHVKTNFTKLAKAIKSNSANNNSIFVLHNLNNASPAVLEKLASLFDRAQSEFSLPDGTTHPKGEINVIGIFNPQNGISNREKLPTSLIYSSIYHIVENPKKHDVLQIIEALFRPTDFKYEVLSFHDKYKKTKKFASQNNASSAVTLYDINKYILFRTVTNGYFNEDLISQILFGYRFLQQETINQVLTELNLLKMVIRPTFIFNEDKKEVYIKQSEQNTSESESTKSLTLKMQSNQNVEQIKQELRTLTIEQQQCLLFLTCAVLSKRACIIQGSTASGKSHIIRLFANMLGRKLNVYQMNSDSGMSILTGQSVLRNEITEKDKKEFQIAFSDLQNFTEIKKFVKENFSIPHKDWKPKQFSELLQLIEKHEKDFTIPDDKKELLKRADARIKQTMSPAKRFHHEESAFIRAMENGEWVVFEDLGSAPPEIEEKLSSLCGDDPEIDLFESGENNFFSRNKPNSRKIHEDFQVFITYNPSSKTGSRALDPNFLNKCFSFTLPPLDSTTKSSAELMRGSLMNYKYDNHLAIDLGKRISNVHQFIKNDCLNNKDSYATDSQFTARTLTFILKEFDRHIANHQNSTKSIYKVLCRSFHLYYLNSYINTDKDMKQGQLIDELSKEIDKTDFDVSCQGVDQKEKYENLLIDLRNIQIFVTSNNEDKKLFFEFNEFIKKCMNVQLTDISFIYDHLNDTLEIIKEVSPIKDNKNWPIYENLYTQIQIVLNLFKFIKNEMGSLNPQYLNMTINNNDLLKLPNFEKPISIVYLLDKLTEKNYFYPATPYILYDDEMIYLLKIICEMAKDPNKQQFNLFISILHDNHELFALIEKLFPYHLFKDKSHPFYMILYWIPLFKKLYDYKITFRVECIQSHEFVFNPKYSDVLPTYIFKEENSLNLSAGSKFDFPDQNKPLKIAQKTNKNAWSKIFYGLTHLLFTDQPKKYQDFKSDENIKAFKNKTPKKETNQYPFLAQFYQTNPDVSLISKLWPIVFNFSPETVKILIDILHPLESDILKTISEIYTNICKYQFDHIFEFIKWISQIGKQQSKLWLIYNNQFKCPPSNNIQKIKIERDQIQREINYLKISPAFDQNIWLPNKYIGKLQAEKIPLDTSIQQDLIKDTENLVRNQLKELITKLENANIKDKESSILKSKIIHQIIQISETSPKPENYKLCEESVNNFLDFLKKGADEISNSIILWPNYVPSKKPINKEAPNIKLYEHVIWFSQVKALVDKICDPNNQNLFNDVFQLNKYPEMQNSAHLLTKKLMGMSSEGNFKINPHDKDSIYSTLNAHFIMKLKNDKVIKNIEKLDKIFNDLSLRKEIKEEGEIQWIHQKANQCHPNLSIVLPKFEPQDLFYIFVGYSGDKENLEKGPAISNINCKNLLDSIANILFSEPNTFVECADKISNLIYRIVFNKDKIQFNHSELKDQFEQELVKSFARITNKNDLEEQNKSRNEVLMDAAIFILDISDRLSSTPYKFTHDDADFLKKDPNWVENTEFIKKYPSLVYWLIKYQKYSETLQNIYYGTSFNENCLPFWLFTLRLMSSQNCVMLDIDSSTAISKEITETMNKYVKSYIRSNNLSDLGTDWLSLVLSSVPSEMIVPQYRIFYDFFKFLSEDNKNNSEIINKYKIDLIKDFTENVCQMVFNKKAKEFLEKPFERLSDKDWTSENIDDRDLAFIYDPNKFINQQIKAFIQNKYLVFRESDFFQTIKSNSIQIEENLKLKVIQLEESIEVEKNNKKEKYIQEQNQKREEDFNRTKNNLITNIYAYNTIFNLLKNIQQELNNNHFQSNPRDNQFQPNQHDNQLQPNQHDNQLQPSQHDNQLQPNQHDNQLQQNQHDNQLQPSQHDNQLQPNQHDNQLQQNQHDNQLQQNQHDNQLQPNQRDNQLQPNQRDNQLQPNQRDNQLQPNQRDNQLQKNQRANQLQPITKNKKDKTTKQLPKPIISEYSKMLKLVPEFSKKANELNKKNSVVNDLIKTNNDPLILYQPSWPDYCNLTLKILDGKKEKQIIDLEVLKKNEYFFPEPFIKKALVFTQRGSYKYYRLKWIPFSFYLINEEQNDLDEICSKQISKFKDNNSIPDLIFGKNELKTSIDFISELKSTVNIFSTFVKEIEEDIQNEKIKKEAFEKPQEIKNKFANLSLLLTASFTDNSECPIVTDQLNELKQIYSQLKNYTDDFETEINKTIRYYYLSFPHLKDDQKLFTYQYQLPLPSQEKIITLGNDLSFDSVAGAEFLSLPILSVEKDKNDQDTISCCPNSLECFIGPIVPSLYSGKCKMNFISFINSPISIEIKIKKNDSTEAPIDENKDSAEAPIDENNESAEEPIDENKDQTEAPIDENKDQTEAPIDENNESAEEPIDENKDQTEAPIDENKNSTEFSNNENQYWIQTKTVIKPSEPCQVLIKIPPSNSEKEENISINTIFIIKPINETSNLHALELPCKFNFELVPLKMLISCKEYPLSFSNDVFYLCAPNINPNSQLTFEFRNKFVNDTCKIAYQLNDFEDNNAEKPDVVYNCNENILSLNIKDVNIVTRLHCTLIISFSEDLKINIEIDSIIAPFEFGFDIYDYSQKKYVIDNSTIYYSSKYINREIVLNCRLYGIFSSEVEALIQNNFNYPISIVNSPNNLTIQDDSEFEIKIQIKDKVPYYSKYFISVKINDIEKKIKLNFEEPKLINLNGDLNESSFKFNNYGFEWKQKEWKELISKSDNSKDIVYIANPFNYLNKFNYQNKSDNIKYHSVPYVKWEKEWRYGKYYVLIFNSPNTKYVTLNENGECNIEENVNYYKYSYSTIFGIAENEWYPVFKDYHEYFKTFTVLEILDENIELAQNGLSKIPDKNYGSSVDFTHFAYILKSGIAVLHNLYNFVGKFPPSFHENEFDDTLNFMIEQLEIIEENNQFLPIIQYNLIFIFYTIFKKRFNEIQNNNGYLFNLMSESIIESKVHELYEQYNEISVLAKSKDYSNESQKKINKIKKEMKEKELHIQPPETEQYISYEISCGSHKPCSEKQIPKQISHSSSQKTFSKDIDKPINIVLPEIVVPSESDIKSYSIQSLNKFYQACTEATRLFPIYVKNILIKDSPEMMKSAKEYFLKLLQIYRPLPNKDYSFIADSVNTFAYSFASMINKFEKAGVDFHELVPKKFIINEQNLQGIIQLPEKAQIILPQDNWKSKKEFTAFEYQGGQILSTGSSVYNANIDDIKIDIHPFIKTDLIDKEPNPQENSNIKRDPKIGDSEFDSFAEMSYISLINKEYNKCNEEEEKFEINQDDTEEQKDNTLRVSANAASGECGQQSIDQENFDGMLSEFTEKDGIERAIACMKEIDQETPLVIQEYKYLNFKSDYLKPDKNYSMKDYPIIPLIQQSFIISQEFVRVATADLDLPYSTLCVNILIDCSAYISDENKIFNLLIICALTDALTTLDIPYSAAVIGDQNYKCIIKPFEEPHSYIALQRICDCIHIKRFRAKLPGCIEYAINLMGFPSETRKNRAVFTFTDGLDENLVKTKGWSEIFKYSQLSFGFVFIKSSELVNENLKFLENVWDTFEKETNGKNSIVKVAKIIADTNLKAQDGNQMVFSNTLKILLELFANVMKRTCRIDEEHIDRNYKTALFEISEDKKLTSIDIFKGYMNEKYGGNKGLYVQRSDVLKNAKSVIDQVDSKQFNNKLNRITTCQVDNTLKRDSKYIEFIREFFQSGKNVNRTSLEKVFQPNKASQTILSSTGTDIDITALILNLINPVPDPMIYLEEKGGLIRNYGVTVVVDASYSCFNSFSSAHSFQTIKSVLASLVAIDLPCFDLIISTNSNPIVLCSQLKTTYALAERSPIWDSLFTTLQNIHPSYNHSDLASAIHTAFDLRRMRTMQCTSSIMFVLTDGLYQATERPRIIECINNCVQSGMITFGIGMGIYPKGIEKLFPQYVFSANPLNVMKGVSDLFTDNYFDYSEAMFCIGSSFESKNLINAIKNINSSAERPLFETFCNELSSITPTIDAFSDFINQEQDIGNAIKGFINPQGKKTELYIKDFLRTQKILIVQFCDDTVCDEPQLNKKYIFENYESGRTECINEAVKFFGISLQVVQNYEDAIIEITKSTNDLCEYYAVWVICGRHPEQLPTGQRSSNKYIVEQFIDVLIKFWKNGGSLVFWADNDPYTFHVNLFLNKVRFENEEKCPSGQVTFQIHGDHDGGQILLGDDSGELKKEKIFNRSPQLFKEVERTKMSHNIGMFNEGKTLSFVENIDVRNDSNYKEKILPFKPFAIDSDGGITILFYPANLKTGTGDIVIDCGFSKLFSDLNLEGTLRYIQNLSGWTCRPEVHMRMNRGKKPCEWRPKAVNHTITNITSPNYNSFINNLIIKLQETGETSVIARTVQSLGGKIDGVLRFSILWNDIGDWDENDLDAHCMQPNGVEIYYSNRKDSSTTGELDVDITHPEKGKPAPENITWTDKNRMCNGTYRFFVHQYAYRNGHSGFRAEIAFNHNQTIYYYDYRQTLTDGVDVNVANVTFQNGSFTISHSLPYKKKK